MSKQQLVLVAKEEQIKEGLNVSDTLGASDVVTVASAAYEAKCTAEVDAWQREYAARARTCAETSDRLQRKAQETVEQKLSRDLEASKDFYKMWGLHFDKNLEVSINKLGSVEVSIQMFSREHGSYKINEITGDREYTIEELGLSELKNELEEHQKARQEAEENLRQWKVKAQQLATFERQTRARITASALSKSNPELVAMLESLAHISLGELPALTQLPANPSLPKLAGPEAVKPAKAKKPAPKKAGKARKASLSGR